MPTVVRFIILGYFFSYIYWVLKVLMILRVWDSNYGGLGGLELKNENRTPRQHQPQCAKYPPKGLGGALIVC